MKKTILLLCLVLAMSMVGCGSVSDPPAQEPNQNAEEQPKENTAVETTLGAGEWYVGVDEDIPPGRYVITPPADKSGNIAIYDDENSASDVREILNPFGTQGVKSLTYELKDGQIIELSGMNEVLFTPKE